MTAAGEELASAGTIAHEDAQSNGNLRACSTLLPG